ncbi:carbohydrate ABC transporter permease [Roseomonas sp. OT10]|uniref:carbohydrate ABC transporter permease n=1 Tax=Roseomonas cutis TaxID=2897332 RepID=UPI001E61CCD2|nr:carbohydrate ABC transporter permease [Roseomonas sp. OT10]UFN48941.1 carbohydrate ABC transporter permease [Roseomonas sp. OT10]
MREPRWPGKLLRLLGAGVAVVWSVFPIAMVVAASFKPPRDIFAIPPSLVFAPTFENYARLWETWPAFFGNMLNSLIVTLGATALTVVASTCAGYVYSRYSGRLLTGSAFFMVVVRMLPPIVVTLPLFPLFSWLRLSDTHLVLILLYAAFFVSLGTWIMRAFIDQVPRELEEAALVDGATLVQILRRVVFPLVLNGAIAASLFVMVYAWNEYIFALVFTTRDARTSPLVIGEMLSTVEGVDWGILFAAATLQLAPVLLGVVAAQRYVIAGLTAGAVKG